MRSSYRTVCHPDGFTMPMLPRSSVGIVSRETIAMALPQRPRESSGV